MQNILNKAARIKLAIFDVDGVLTDGSLYFGSGGQEFKVFNTRDGHGMRMLQHYGIEIAIITGRQSEAVEQRMRDLEIQHVYQGQREKTPVYQQLLDTLQLEPSQTAYVGDDVVDLGIMKLAGLGIAVKDAHPFVRQHADWITHARGGHGAVREVCELLLQAHGLLDKAIEYYLR